MALMVEREPCENCPKAGAIVMRTRCILCPRALRRLAVIELSLKYGAVPFERRTRPKKKPAAPLTGALDEQQEGAE